MIFDTLTNGLKSIESTIAVLFRIDDVIAHSQALMRLLELFADQQVPLHLAVIPAQINAKAADELRQVKGQLGSLIEIGQHGFNHRNHSSGKQPYEFGPNRTYSHQFSDVKNGKQYMEQLFAQDFTLVFTPPYNTYDHNTLRALKATGISLLSATRTNLLNRYKTDLREVSVNIDPIEKYFPEPVTKSIEVLIEEIFTEAKSHNYLGFMLHHELFQEDFFSLLDALLKALRRSPNVQFYKLTEYAQLFGSSPFQHRNKAEAVKYKIRKLLKRRDGNE